jgi:hypothetical protein
LTHQRGAVGVDSSTCAKRVSNYSEGMTISETARSVSRYRMPISPSREPIKRYFSHWAGRADRARAAGVPVAAGPHAVQGGVGGGPIRRHRLPRGQLPGAAAVHRARPARPGAARAVRYPLPTPPHTRRPFHTHTGVTHRYAGVPTAAPLAGGEGALKPGRNHPGQSRGSAPEGFRVAGGCTPAHAGSGLFNSSPPSSFRMPPLSLFSRRNLTRPNASTGREHSICDLKALREHWGVAGEANCEEPLAAPPAALGRVRVVTKWRGTPTA